MKELGKILSEYGVVIGNVGELRAYSADQIREAYEAGLNADKWISVDDEMPVNEQQVNVLLKNKRVRISTFRKDKLNRNGFYCGDSYAISWNEVTHWQPLPSAPKV